MHLSRCAHRERSYFNAARCIAQQFFPHASEAHEKFKSWRFKRRKKRLEAHDVVGTRWTLLEKPIALVTRLAHCAACVCEWVSAACTRIMWSWCVPCAASVICRDTCQAWLRCMHHKRLFLSLITLCATPLPLMHVRLQSWDAFCVAASRLYWEWSKPIIISQNTSIVSGFDKYIFF